MLYNRGRQMANVKEGEQIKQLVAEEVSNSTERELEEVVLLPGIDFEQEIMALTEDGPDSFASR